MRHWLLQIIWPFKAPSIYVTREARMQMERVMSGLAYEPVATIMWISQVPPSGSTNPRWMVAYYDLNTRPSGRVTTIGGIPFVFIQSESSRLNGATLDYRHERFVVEGAK